VRGFRTAYDGEGTVRQFGYAFIYAGIASNDALCLDAVREGTAFAANLCMTIASTTAKAEDSSLPGTSNGSDDSKRIRPVRMPDAAVSADDVVTDADSDDLYDNVACTD